MEAHDLKNMDVKQALQDASTHVEEIFEERERAEAFFNQASEKAETHQGRIQEFWQELQDLLRLIAAWWEGNYTDIPWRTMTVVIGAVVYFVNPLDLIPDVIPGIGYLDDAAVVGFVIASIQIELETFRTWPNSEMGSAG